LLISFNIILQIVTWHCSQSYVQRSMTSANLNLKSWLYREATPTRAQINAALKALSKYIAAFLAAFSAFDAVASWLLVEEIPSEFVRACECS